MIFSPPGGESAREVSRRLHEQGPRSCLQAFPVSIHGFHGAIGDVGRRCGWSDRRWEKAAFGRSNSVSGLEVRLLDLFRLNHQQNTHSDVLVQGLLVRQRYF